MEDCVKGRNPDVVKNFNTDESAGESNKIDSARLWTRRPRGSTVLRIICKSILDSNHHRRQSSPHTCQSSLRSWGQSEVKLEGWRSVRMQVSVRRLCQAG